MPDFCHLHCHSQFSLLDGAASIPGMMAKAKADGMKAVALTDHGNMFGVFKFVTEAEKHGIKPIVGCEFYVVEDRHRRSFTGGDRDNRYHQLMLAKNQEGYKNLSKLCSLGFIEGLYGKYPRIDKELIKKYKDGIIATTCCIGAEVPQAILHKSEEEAEKVFLEWLDIFGEDYYIELQRHDLKDLDRTGKSQEDVNQVLLKWSKKYNVPVIATNDSHYVNEEDWNAHDILLCINTGDSKATPIGDGRNERFGFPNNQFYFKTQAEMLQKFSDVPHALDNTNLIIDKITPPQLQRDVLLPHFVLPPGFKTQDEYLRYLTYEGAKKRYGEITEEIRERLDFELSVIQNTGYPGYFLIVQDFTSVARQLGVSVGPGRGSAAGSAVAYCVGITNVDPIKYDLLFERFLNPERVSLPDIDIDFDDVGRGKVIDYVVDKYGKQNVAQIITYGSMAAKSSIRDVGRVLDLPLPIVDKIAKKIPDISLKSIFNDDIKVLKERLNSDQMLNVEELRTLSSEKSLEGEVLREAQLLEGSVRNTGIHACGVIITPEEITNLIPVTTAKDSDLLVTQFDNSVVESAGLLKMDFLGLRTLSIIKDAIALIKQRFGIDIDPDEIPLEDEKTYELFQKGQTIGIFQFESDGMQKHLRALKPTKFEDLIAMNALYRPGPMEYIPNFVDRKHGREEIVYDDPDMKEFLEETYGITVYQEQVMLLSQKLAGFSKGEADNLRKAMGKKKKDIIDKMKPDFIKGAEERGHQPTVMEKVWKDWEAFAAYAFNKSHATCYSVVAFQTAYLKAHYPAEYMAAVLTHNMSDIKKLSMFMEECKNMKIEVLSPDINESLLSFSVNNEGNIRVGMAAIKGVGEAAAEEIVRERNDKGAFDSIFDLTKRVNLRTVNKKSLEALALAGAFDRFEGCYRSMLVSDNSETSGIELALKFGNQYQAEQLTSQASLFGGDSGVSLSEPKLPEIPPWNKMEMLNREKEVIGMYISGHPLDAHKTDIEIFCNMQLADLTDENIQKINRPIKLAGIVTVHNSRINKSGKAFGIFTVEDYSGTYEFALFGDDYAKFRGYLAPNSMLYLTAKTQDSFRDPGRKEIRLVSIDYLEDIREKYLEKLTLTIDLEKLDDKMVTDLHTINSDNKGTTSLVFEIRDKELRYKIDLLSTGQKINVTNEYISELRRMDLMPRFNG
ncbi:MAG: DNA polymerase III subunit alpha [Flavobacteriales bacterium]|nr:DNA polymerase III subunit alpha [Flavobacteriales bacterium]